MSGGTTTERRLRRSSLLAGVGEGVVATALPLLAADVTRDPLAVAGVVAAQHLPWLAVALLWHRLAANDRRTVVGLVHTARALAVGYLGFTIVAGTDTILRIQLVAVVIGLGEALAGVVEEETEDTSTLSRRGMVGLALVGMPLGGVLYEVFLAVPFLMDVLFFALAALFALFVPRPVVPEADVAETTSRPTALMVTAAVSSAASGAALGVLVLFALTDLGLGAPAFGLLLAALSGAAAVGAWIAPETGAALGLRAGFAVAAVVAAAGLVTAAQVGDPSRPWAAALALAIAWGTGTTARVLLRALLPVATGAPADPATLRAQHVVEWTAVCAGALAGGWLARRTAVADVLVWAAGAHVLAAASSAAIRRIVPVRGDLAPAAPEMA